MAQGSSGLAAVGEGLGSMIGGGLVLAGLGGEGGTKYLRKIKKAWDALQTSDFNLSKLAPPELEVVAEMFPELMEAWTPERAEQIAGSPEMREAQARQLMRMEEVAGEGVPLADRLASRQAAEAVQRAARGSREAVLANLAARGQLGAGDELAARMVGQQQAANLAGELGSENARQAALRRLAAVGTAGEMAGAIRGQDVAEQSTNAQLASRFNELLANVINQARAQNQAAAQQAQAYNVGTKQRVAEANPMLRYQAALENINRENMLKGQLFQQQVQKLGGLGGAWGGLAEQKNAEQAARNAAIMGTAQGAGKAVGGVADIFTTGGFGF